MEKLAWQGGGHAKSMLSKWLDMYHVVYLFVLKNVI